MHIWHYANALPKHVSFTVNYGLILSICDYFSKTDDIPHSAKNIKLGCLWDDSFLKDFINQGLQPLM